MIIRLWGVRGTIPTPDQDKIKVGGHTTCVEVQIDDTIIIFDAGTGIVPLGKKLSQQFKDKTVPPIHLFISHTHWDHIYGFPFFGLLFSKGTQINIYGPWKEHRSLKDTMLVELEYDFCPINFNTLPAFIDFFDIQETTINITKDIKVISKKHIHPGGAFSYRVEAHGKVFVFITDVEHYPSHLDERVIDISKDADLLLHDAQYTSEEIEQYIGWGHSTWNQGIDVARQANVKRLGFMHHHPERSDKEIDKLEKMAQKEFENSFFAREGLEFEL